MLAAALLFAAFPASASDTAGGDAAEVFQFALQNGMQVVVIPDAVSPVVTQTLWFKAGAMDDPPGQSGLADFLEHMMFRGTKALPGDGFAETIAKNGGVADAVTTHDYTEFYEQVAADRLKLAMGLEADRIANLDISDAGVAAERDVMLAERRTHIDADPQTQLREQMEAALHLSHPYGRPVLGWPDEIRHIDRAAVRGFYRRHYAPNNAVLVIAGGVTPADVRDLAQATYGKVGARALVPRAEYNEPPRLAETRMTLPLPGARTPLFERIWRVPSYAQAAPGQAEAFEVLARALGGDPSSALYRTLVVEKKLATSAGAAYDGYARDAGEFSVFAAPRPGVSLQTLEHAIDAVIAPFMHGNPRPADLARARTRLVAETQLRRDNQLILARAYGRALMIGLTVDDVDEWPRRIRAVSGADLHAAAALLVPPESVTAYLLPGPGK